MIELILAGVGVLGVGMGGMWVKTRRRTNHGNTAVAVDRFEDASRRVSAAQALWYDLSNEALIVGGGLGETDIDRMERDVAAARESSRELYEVWLPISDVDGDAVASYSDLSREKVTEHKMRALVIVEEFEGRLSTLESTLDELRS